MPNLRELVGNMALTELASQVGIPFRRLEAYLKAERALSQADREALAAFFAIAPNELVLDRPQLEQPAPKASGRAKKGPPIVPRQVNRMPRPAGVPQPSSVVTNYGKVEVRITGVLQRDPEPASDSRSDAQGEPRFWQLELLVPHQPLRGEALYPTMTLRCAVHRRRFDAFRWLRRGDKVVLSGTLAARADHLYLFVETLSTPRADRILKLLDERASGHPEAEAGLQKLLGDNWPAQIAPVPGEGLQAQRPVWSPEPSSPTGPQGRIQITVTGQLQSDPSVDLDEETGGTAELLLAIAPREDERRLPVQRYLFQMRLRTLRDFLWLQRGDTIRVSGDVVRLGHELLVEATTIQLPLPE
jgi:hypothetical protein